MAVLQMQRICICALKKDRKQLLEFLQRRSVIEINDVIPEDSVFQKRDVTVAGALLTKNISSARDALQILASFSVKKESMLSVLNGRKAVSEEAYEEFSAGHDSVIRTVNRIHELSRTIAENKAEILKLRAKMEVLQPWVTLDIPMNFTGTKSTGGFIGTLPDARNLEEIYGMLSEFTPVHADIISSSREQTCIFVLCTKDNSAPVFEALRANGFSYPNGDFDKVPSQQLKELENQLEVAEKSIHASEEEIKSYESAVEDIRFLQDYETMRAEKYDVISHLLQSKKTFLLTGYIPEAEVKELTDALNRRFELAIETEQPSEDEDVPVLLRNNGFSNPLEGTVESYSPPARDELDPTTVMSLFYYVLYGLMLSDAGYGLIMTIACAAGLIKFNKNLELSMRKTLKMFLFCGISTVFWGIMFGSYFGNIVDVVSENFFGHKTVIPPLWFFPVNEPMRMLVFAMLVGIIHLFTGLGMKLYYCIKQKDYKSAVYDVIFWYVLLISSLIVLLSMKMVVDILGLSFTLPSAAGNIAGIFAIISAIGIISTNGRESRNPFKRFLKGLYAFYGITGYLSDVLSYSRLLALGLATGIIATVINQMAAMVGGGVIGVILFIIIEIFGHALNLSINALGAYVHTNRLQYVEFFGKFFNGGGRKFNPFSSKTKYYKIKENVNNG